MRLPVRIPGFGSPVSDGGCNATSESPYNEYVADHSCAVAPAPDERIEEDPAELAAQVRVKLNAAIQLACEAEHERRSRHWDSADEYQRQWDEVIAEVKRLLPLVRKSGVSLFATERAGRARSESNRR